MNLDGYESLFWKNIDNLPVVQAALGLISADDLTHML